MKLNKSLIIFSTLVLPFLAMAQDAAGVHGASIGLGLGYLASGLGIGIAAAMVGYSQSKAAVAALDGIARNPAAASALFLPLLLSLAFMEALVLFAWLIASSLAGKA